MKIISKNNIDPNYIPQNFKFENIDTNSREGKLLVAALAYISVKIHSDRIYDYILEHCIEVANQVYYKETYNILKNKK